MYRDLNLKADSIDYNNNIFGVSRDFIAPKDLRKTVVGLLSFFVYYNKELV